MATRGYPRDGGLAARMLFVMFLLGLLYVLFVGLLAAIGLSLVIVLVIAGGFLLAQYWFSDRIALFSMGGKEVSPAEAPELHAIVDRLCLLADLPKPKVAIADSDMPNAFATGRNQSSAVVCVTTGIMRRLDEPEMEAVLSHELSHVAHRDVAVMTIAGFLGIAAGLLTRMFFYSGLFGGFGGGGDDDDHRGLPVVLVVMLVSALVYVLSFVLTRALSRYRELSADRAGALLTGAPSKLASALVKISGEMARIPTRDLRAAEPLNAFFFAPALAPGFSLSSLFSTHPPLERRLDQLAKLESGLGRQS
ncbi:MAG TPA: zinc metalloprotease HtpX [Acidimicrobiales bacterium]|nr:zinc metalloprotease HtpX [Acidimicrobiales bacterium]